MNKGDIAKENFSLGLNCAQAVLLAFKDEIGVEEETLKKIIIGFGGGFARQRLVCGAVSGMTAAISYLLSNGNDKLNAYAIVKEALDLFKEKTGSLVCAELLASEKIPCAELCAIAAQIVQEMVEKHN